MKGEQLKRRTTAPQKVHSLSTPIIRHAYEQTLNACARLSLFATGSAPTSDGPIEERQSALAVEDLINFAIHARRLIDTTTLPNHFRGVRLPPLTQNSSGETAVRKIIGIIVHHDYIDVLRTDNDVTLRHAVFSGEDVFKKHPELFLKATPRKSISPIVVIGSDKAVTAFRLNDLVEVFQKEILTPIVNLCAEQKLFLDMDWD